MPAHRSPPRLIPAVVCLLFGCGLTTLNLDTLLSDGRTATTLLSSSSWRSLVERFGGHVEQAPAGHRIAEIDWSLLGSGVVGIGLVTWFLGAGLISWRAGRSVSHALADWGRFGWRWWLIPGLWEALWIVFSLTGFEAGSAFLLGTPHLWLALMLAGWLVTGWSLAAPDRAVSPADLSHGAQAPLSRKRRSADAHSYTVPATVWIGVLLYVAVYTAMNWQLYRGLLVPHGDSVMYEEHLWNLTHGKGFRSYLDQGLFLGEHVQVIHVLLVPLYLLWPSHLLLELCETVALGSGAFPVFWLARRHIGSLSGGAIDDRGLAAAALLALAYLLYFPMQFLDIAIDLKTFRPISFGVPLMLFALDQFERGRWWTMIVLLLAALSAKEDYALVIAPLGVWMALRRNERAKRQAASLSNHGRWWGMGLTLLGVVYLVLATRVVIPWFRGGEEVHYARYFSQFGETLGEIGWNMLTRPGLLAGELLTMNTVIYALSLLLPLGFLPAYSPGRLAVALPAFGLLCLNEVAQDPRHHFHAPLVPILLWAAAAGLGKVQRPLSREPETSPLPEPRSPRRPLAGSFAFTCALTTGLFFSLGPLGLPFWDPGSHWYWRELYVPGKRAALFPRVQRAIPQSARVASTDFVHPRFTHYERSYDYSQYRREVSNYKLRVPDDTDYIVIDTQHPYSEIKTPDQVPEFREHPERWDLLTDIWNETQGYFIVLKRREA